MRNHEGARRQFYRTDKAYYAAAVMNHEKFKHEVMVGLYHQPGGTSGEFAVRWYDLEGNAPPTPRLEVYRDGWSALATMPDLLTEMAQLDTDGRAAPVSADDFCAMLRRLGFEDATKYEDPARKPSKERTTAERLRQEGRDEALRQVAKFNEAGRVIVRALAGDPRQRTP